MTKYRPEIDGMRAVAVLAVILSHMSARILPGGFVGVDIFFVISGYLITGIVYRQITTHTFSFGVFYVRRMRRILPVYFLVLFASFAAGVALLVPKDLAALMESIRYSIFFGANVYFSWEKGYFDISSDEKPLLHLWSLSVEEQYYLLWPLLLLCLCFLARRACQVKAVRDERAVIIPVVGIIGIAFALLSQHMVSSPSINVKGYYLIQSRAFELLVGSLTALLPAGFRRCPTLFSGLGLLAILASFFALSPSSPFPGFNALLPCIGAALILYFSRHECDRGLSVRMLLANPVFVWVGVLSYSMYLWHWPILAYMRYVYGRSELPATWLVAAFLGTVLLSWLFYHGLEKRVRRINFSFGNAFGLNYLAPALAVLLLCGFANKALVAGKKPDIELTRYGTDVCHGNFAKQCLRGDRQAVPPVVLMTGDSHAAQYNSFIDVVGEKERWSAWVVTASSCSPVFGYDQKVLPRWAQAPCSRLKTYFQENYDHYKYIFLASAWAYQLGMLYDKKSGLRRDYDADYLSKLRNTLAVISKNHQVYVFSDVPMLRRDPFRMAKLEKLGLTLKEQYDPRVAKANAVIRHLVADFPNVHWVDTQKYILNLTRDGLYNGKPVYMDDQHLNKYGAAMLGQWFSKNQTLLSGKQKYSNPGR